MSRDWDTLCEDIEPLSQEVKKQVLSGSLRIGQDGAYDPELFARM